MNILIAALAATTITMPGQLMVTTTVDGVDYPVCYEEDGSDLPPELLPCVWTNDGRSWLTFGDYSLPIIPGAGS